MVKTVNGKEKRTFKVVEVKDQKGKSDAKMTKVASGMNLTGTHQSAARKAGGALCRYKKIKGSCVMFITVRESSQGSEGKERTYKVRRFKLDKPLELAGRVIEYSSDAKPIKGSVKVASKTKRATSTKKTKKTKKSSK